MNAAMIAGYNALGLTLFRALAQADGNVVMSPLSIGMTLAMGFAGAAGETADEMARTLAFDGARPDLFAANAELLRHYAETSAPEAARVRLANALVLTQHGEAVAKAYRDLLAESFRGGNLSRRRRAHQSMGRAEDRGQDRARARQLAAAAGRYRRAAQRHLFQGAVGKALQSGLDSHHGLPARI